MDKIHFTQYSYQLEKHLNFRKFVNMTVLHGVYYPLVSLCINSKAKEEQHQKEISQIFELGLPVIMSNFNKRRVNSQPHGRYRIFVNTLAGTVLDESEYTLSLSKSYEETIG